MGIAHLAFNLGPRHKRRDRVDHHQVHRAAAHQHVADLQGLLARVRLRDQQVVNIHAELARIIRVQGVFGVDEGAGLALFLRLGDRRQGQGGLAGGFRPIDFNDTAIGQAARAERNVKAQRTRAHGRDAELGPVAHLHHGTLAKLFLNLAQRDRQRPFLVIFHIRRAHFFVSV